MLHEARLGRIGERTFLSLRIVEILNARIGEIASINRSSLTVRG